MVVHLTDQNFADEVENYAGVVLVDFHALWRGPCKRQEPIINALADKYQGKVKIAKLDVDEAGQTAQRFDIMSIPTVILFKDGKPTGESMLGLQQPSTLENAINQLLEAK